MRLNLFKAIRNDAIFTICVLFAIVPQLFVMYQTNFYLDLDWSSYSTIALTAMSSVANFVFFWRLFGVIRLLRTGVVVKGTIVWKSIVRDRGTLGFRYEYQNHRVEKKISIMVTKWTNVMIQGSEITVIFDANHPQKALIASLFSDDFER